MQLSYHASAGKNCAPALPPTVSVTQAPKAGTLVVRKAVLTTDKIAGCPRLKTPAQVVFSQARADYAGPERRRIGRFAATLTAREASNYFRHAGYA